jgi:hypothetical protein
MISCFEDAEHTIVDAPEERMTVDIILWGAVQQSNGFPVLLLLRLM